ncbi:MAG TPA: cyclic-di-AMP receptor [Anaerolineales bacterium]
MKMIILILKDNDADEVTQALTADQYRVTRVASTGGFLRSGVVTLLIGVRDERAELVQELIRAKLPPLSSGEKRATWFVVPVERFEQV